METVIQMRATFKPIGTLRSCFTEKFGIPRQPGLVPEAQGVLELLPPYDRQEALEGLAGFSHIWVLYLFHANGAAAWRPKVRPPRLGGNRAVGVFATRSGFRPNPIGMSALQLLGIETGDGPTRLRVAGVDMLDGTPVLDIKPYLPYADRIDGAVGGYAPLAPREALTVVFSPAALEQCRRLESPRRPQLQRLIAHLLALDPRPAYRAGDPRRRCFGMRLFDLDVRGEADGRGVCVTAVVPWGKTLGGVPLRRRDSTAGCLRRHASKPNLDDHRAVTAGAGSLVDRRPPLGPKEAAMPVKKILWPTDFSDRAEKALPYVNSLTQKYDAEIHVLYVIEDLTVHKWYGEFEPERVTRIREWEEKTARTRLEETCSTYLNGCPLYVKHVAVGDPANEILKFIEREGVDMVVMASRGAEGHFTFGSVAEKVVKNAPIPVVTIPVSAAA
jgi:tRNA-Thr(GGU) m(6)t(6)A37 methyltransferase TsaA